MKYQYFYQTRENENRSGWIKARSRESAYTLLRKQGIKPYRVVGDDPVNWRPWALAALIAALAAGLVAALVHAKSAKDDRSPRPRGQIYGDRALIAAGVYSEWRDELASPLDRFLAAYAQPGSAALPPLLTADEVAAFPAELERPVAYAEGERTEVRQLKNIIAWLREEMRGRLAAGDSVGQYMAFLEERQQQERELRDRAAASLHRVPESHLYNAWLGVNARLRERGIAPLDMPAALQDRPLLPD